VLLNTYDEARLLWEAKGYTIDGIATTLASQEPSTFPKDCILAPATLQRYSVTDRTLPEPIARLIESLPPMGGRTRQAEVVELGLRTLKGLPLERNPLDVAHALLSCFPTDQLALQLADAVSNLARVSSGAGSLLDVFARSVADRVPRLPKASRFSRMLARHLTLQLDRLGAGRLSISGAVGGLAGGLIACGVLLLGSVALLAFILSGRSSAGFAFRPEVSPSPSVVSSPQAGNIRQMVVIITNGTQAGTPVVFDLQALLGAITAQWMGSKAAVDMSLPSQPLPYQKVPPCLEEAGERSINGACWFGSKDSKPPCGRYLFHGPDGCYRPVAADPQRPVGLQPATSGEQP